MKEIHNTSFKIIFLNYILNILFSLSKISTVLFLALGIFFGILEYFLTKGTWSDTCFLVFELSIIFGMIIYLLYRRLNK